MGTFVFFMQAGFAFLEAGAVRGKNVTTVLLKNMADAVLVTAAYWILGYGWLGYGFFTDDQNGVGFIGWHGFMLINVDEEDYAWFYFQLMFAATSVTIVGGAMAERTKVLAYLINAVIMGGWTYPMITHWVWSPDGWMYEHLKFKDFAGSGVVHITGGAVAGFAALCVGPRIGRFEGGKSQVIAGHSTVLITLGTLILWFGFFAFNLGSVVSIVASPADAARAAVNTALAPAFAGLSATILAKVIRGQWSLGDMCNGLLTGAVAICAGADTYEPWAAVVIGTIAGPLYIGASYLLLLIKIDDPLDATAVHLFGGFWGIIAVALFANSALPQSDDGGIFYAWDRDSFSQFGRQLAGAFCITIWSILCSAVYLVPLKIFGQLRVSKNAEIEGQDYKDGQPAYPLDMNMDDEFDDGSDVEYEDPANQKSYNGV
eukprot:TRINITY_DN2145_c0_g1_i1.p1 TRINITY_DN2145_c0_g1~~TRINITY_DN2145_c0_g1_i1.p1  ORF type:complete len:430 (+),score=68.72 TRINITY_DN2145_c0_g1_i1:426-1715(+)